MNKLRRFLTTVIIVLMIASITIPVYGVTYKYDDLNRLIEVTYDSGQKIVYTYDAGGNMLTAQDVSPVKLNQIGDKEVIVGQELKFVVGGTGPDGSTLTFSASNLPQGASFNPDTKEFNWTPTLTQVGVYSNVRFEVTDGVNVSSEEITIAVVTGTNSEPILNPIGSKEVFEGETLTIILSAVDPDGDVLTYSVGNLPQGAALDPQTGEFSWTPGRGQKGVTSIRFEVSDGVLSDSENVSITVKGFTPTTVIGSVDRPPMGRVITGVYRISGWLYDPEGVSKIEVLVDGSVAGEAVYGNSRPDVQKIYPELGSNLGYHYDLDTTKLSEGEHTITVRETSNSGTQTSLTSRTVTIVRQIVTGNLERPANGAISGITKVSGWIYDSDGVSKVEILVDGVVVGQATYGISRPDVKKVYPEFGSNVGFSYDLDTTKLSEGEHKISARETGNKGTQVLLKTITVNVPKQIVKGYIDRPRDKMISGISRVSGWIYDSTGVAKVEVLVDGKVVGEAAFGHPRPDVEAVYPEYKGTIGFSYDLDTTKLSEGDHIIEVGTTGNNGVKTSLNRKLVTVPKQIVKGYLERPRESTISGISKVSGWIYDSTGIEKIEVQVDGITVGEAVYGIDRPDVLLVYPQFIGVTGFSYELDTTKLSEGQHTITVLETGKTGIKTTLNSRTVTVPKQIMQGYIDRPRESTISGITRVSGWVYDSTGVTKVEVLVDGKVVGEASYGAPRPDVVAVYPDYDANTGFSYDLDTTLLQSGSHVITVRSTGNNGCTRYLNKITVNVSN